MSDKLRRTEFAVLAPDRSRALTPSRTRLVPSAGQIMRRQRFLRLMKMLMPALAVGVLVLLLFWPDIEGRDGRLSFRRGPAMVAEALQLVAPRFQGVDEVNRPYTITARLARQPGQENVMLLEFPRGDIQLTDGAWVFVESNNGRYDRTARHLDLEGDVRIFHDNGTLFRTEAAAVQVDAGTANGQRPTWVQGSFGTIESEGFEMLERGTVMIFTGRARALLEGRQQ